MKIKLSDYILENSISNSDVADIEMEQLKAQINVCCELANLYIKQMNMGVVMEAAPAQQPPTMPTKDQLQQPSSGYTQDIDTDMPSGYNSPYTNNQQNIPSGLKTFLEKDKTILGNYTASNGETYVITAEKPTNPTEIKNGLKTKTSSYPISAQPGNWGDYLPYNTYSNYNDLDPNTLFVVTQ